MSVFRFNFDVMRTSNLTFELFDVNITCKYLHYLIILRINIINEKRKNIN